MELLQSTVMAKQKRSKKPLLAIVIFLILLLIGGAIYHLLTQRIIVEAKNYQKSNNQYLAAEKFEAAYGRWFVSKSIKYNSALSLGVIYENRSDCHKGLIWYQSAEKVYGMPAVGEAEGAARCAEKIGNNELALKYYKITLELIQEADQRRAEKDPQAAGEASALKAKIAELERSR